MGSDALWGCGGTDRHAKNLKVPIGFVSSKRPWGHY